MIRAHIEIEQTLHGYDNGHRLLASSVALDSRDERALLTMSDLSGPRAVENFLEYLTGYMLPSGSHYALAKTWYAAEMERPGCVWTHTLLIPRDLLPEVKNAEGLLPLFFRPKLKSGYRYADRITVNLESIRVAGEGKLSILHDERVACAIEELYSSDEDTIALPATSGTEFEVLLLRLWSQAWPRLRETLSFCTGSLGRRSLNNRQLVIQCGPDRVMRELRANIIRECEQSPWLGVILRDLEESTSLRTFLLKHATSFSNRSSMSLAAQIYLSLEVGDISEALRALSRYQEDEEGIESLRFLVLQEASKKMKPRDLLATLLNAAIQKSFKWPTSVFEDPLKKSLAQDGSKTLSLLAGSLPNIGMKLRRSLVNMLCGSLKAKEFEYLLETHPKFFHDLFIWSADLAYEPAIWISDIPLLEKGDLLEGLFARPEIDRSRLFEVILDSENSDLTSQLTRSLSESDLPAVLHWIERTDAATVVRPQWISFLKQYQSTVVQWVNGREATEKTALLLANILDFPLSEGILSDSAILDIARKGSRLKKSRHEVAAFIYVTTAIVDQVEAASYCVDSFTLLHREIAESQLSNRAWQIIEPSLVPLPHEQWDACEKLRRAILHFVRLHNWPPQSLWQALASNSDLFHDFLRTSKNYEVGRSFFALIRDAGIQGECAVSKQQFKEIKKLLK